MLTGIPLIFSEAVDLTIMKNCPHFSVVIPSFNRASLIVEAIRSIEQQTLREWECLIVDDGSTDNTDEMVRPLQLKDNRIKYLKIPHGGVAAARNTGIEQSRGDVICFLDSDDTYEPNTLELFAKAFEKYSNDIFAYGPYMDNDLKKDPANTDSFTLHDIYPQLVYGNCVSTVVAFKNDKTSCPRFREDLVTAEDYQFALDLARKAMGVRINRKLFSYRLGPQNKSTHYIADGSYIEAICSIVERELVTLESSMRNDVEILSNLWQKRISALRILSAAFKNEKKKLYHLIGCTSAVEFEFWADARYVLYRLDSFSQRCMVAENLIHFLNTSRKFTNHSDIDKIIAAITDRKSVV